MSDTWDSFDTFARVGTTLPNDTHRELPAR
jgi:hypothetical protein